MITQRGDCWSPIYRRWWNVEFLNHPTASFSTSKNKWRKTIWNISCGQHPVVNVCLLEPCCATNEVQRPGDITWRFTNGSPQLLSSMLNDVDETFCSKLSTSLMKELIESNIDSAANTLAGPLSERWLRLQKQRRLIFMLSFVFNGTENRSSTYMNAVHCCVHQYINTQFFYIYKNIGLVSFTIKWLCLEGAGMPMGMNNYERTGPTKCCLFHGTIQIQID